MCKQCNNYWLSHESCLTLESKKFPEKGAAAHAYGPLLAQVKRPIGSAIDKLIEKWGNREKAYVPMNKILLAHSFHQGQDVQMTIKGTLR